MECHTDAAARHGELGYTGLEEGSAEVALNEGVGLLEEAVGLVRVGEVGRSHNHILHLCSEETEHVGRSVTCGVAGLLLDRIPVEFGEFACKPLGHLYCEVGVLSGPSGLLGIFLLHYLLEFGCALVVECLYFGEDLEGVLEVATEVLDGVHIGVSTEGCTVCSAASLVAAAIGAACTETHDGLTDDECGALLLGFRFGEGCAYLVGVVTVDGDDLPVPSLVLLGYVLACHLVAVGRELHVVRVVEHDEVVESEVTGDTACTL